MRWYVTVAAVRQWQRICGYPAADDGHWFDRAEEELADLCEIAVPRAAGKSVTPIYVARSEIRGKRVRVELYVSYARRPEGPLPQLVRVRLKDRIPPRSDQ